MDVKAYRLELKLYGDISECLATNTIWKKPAIARQRIAHGLVGEARRIDTVRGGGWRCSEIGLHRNLSALRFNLREGAVTIDIVVKVVSVVGALEVVAVRRASAVPVVNVETCPPGLVRGKQIVALLACGRTVDAEGSNVATVKAISAWRTLHIVRAQWSRAMVIAATTRNNAVLTNPI